MLAVSGVCRGRPLSLAVRLYNLAGCIVVNGSEHDRIKTILEEYLCKRLYTQNTDHRVFFSSKR
jgi:hypothetical protein